MLPVFRLWVNDLLLYFSPEIVLAGYGALTLLIGWLDHWLPLPLPLTFLPQLFLFPGLELLHFLFSHRLVVKKCYYSHFWKCCRTQGEQFLFFPRRTKPSPL
jgi:hypothetical protein